MVARGAYPVVLFLNINESHTGFKWNKSPTNITEILPKSRARPMISRNRLWTNISIPEPTIDTSSIYIYFTPIICILNVLRLSVSKDVYCNSWFTGIFKAECNVFPLISYAAFPVGAINSIHGLSGSTPGFLFKYLYSDWYSNVVTWVLPTPAPADKNLQIASSDVFAWWRTSITNSHCCLFNFLMFSSIIIHL